MNAKVALHEAWSGAADCRQCKLRESALFAGLEERDFEKIHHPIDQIELSPGQKLYASGAVGDRLYTIRSGIIKLVQYLPDGGQRIVRLARTADVVGLESLLGQAYEHDAIALQPTELCSLPAATVEKLGQENPALHVELLKRWHRALSEADAWLTELSTGPARLRVARMLARVVREQDPPECILFSREDIGAMLGITTETASRTIAEFKRGGLLTEVQGQLHRVDVDKLESVLAE